MFGSIQSAPLVCRATRPRTFARAVSSRRAFTLLELLIATAITMLMMISLVQVFKVVADSMKQGRAILQLNNSLRSATFRLRNDLSNLTVRVHPPSDSSTGAGYLEYFDGSMTDYTCTLFDELNSIDAKLTYSAVRSSRYGDLDDILMFTARAGGDTWFVGQVPAFVLDQSLLVAPKVTQDSDSDGILDPVEMVTITSQLAEIVVFARPVNSDGVTATLFDDADGNHLPDAYQLHYRTLLIRPDLNIMTATGSAALPNSLPGSALGPWLCAGSIASPAAPLDMARSHQQCDLSIRRVYNGAPDTDAVAANSLEDLMNPANRFAHFEFSADGIYPGSVGAASTTMPLLVMQPIPRLMVASPLPGTCLNVFGDDGKASTFSPLYSDPNPASMPPGLAGAAGNFLHPSFVLAGARLGQDILASDCLAFDVKIFDEGAPVLGLAGVDGTAGTTASTVIGADGSDDIILSPNDPGYAAALASSVVPTVVSYGAYVDLLWGRKTLSSLPCFPPGGLDVGDVFTNQPGVNLWTAFSGLVPPSPLPSAAAPPLGFIEGLRRSGKLIRILGTEPPIVLQPTFDTWSTYYENDGSLQGELGSVIQGVVNVDRLKRMQDKNNTITDVGNALPAYRQTSFDAGIDGVDNDLTGGTDDSTELESGPPFPVAPRGLKISIRLEDRAARQVKQMSIANEFVTQ